MGTIAGRAISGALSSLAIVRGRSDPWLRWGRKDCCLPSGGPNPPTNPPTGKDCPNSWSWHHGFGCCTPHQPPSNNSPPPQCNNGWGWSDNSLCCNPPSTPSNPSPPSTPSGKPGDNDHNGNHNGDHDHNGNHNGDGDHDNNGNHYGNGHKRFTHAKRQNRSRNVAPCPRGLSACPISSLVSGDYECVDTYVDLDNCGGCAVLGEGQNCNAIPGVWNVECEQSACKSKSIAPLFTGWTRLTCEISLYVRGWLQSFQRRKDL